MSAAGAVVPTPERRRERRIAVHLPIFVRGTDRTGQRFEEKTTSENLCRGGAAFATRYGLDLGMKVDITIPSNSATREPQPEFSTYGRVVHLAPGKTEHERIVGVEFTGPHFHRMFVSETTDRDD